MNKKELVDAILSEIGSRKAAKSEDIADLFNLTTAQVAGVLTTMRRSNQVVRSAEGWWALNHTDLNMAKSILINKETSTRDLATVMFAMCSKKETT